MIEEVFYGNLIKTRTDLKIDKNRMKFHRIDTNMVKHNSKTIKPTQYNTISCIRIEQSKTKLHARF